MRWEQMWLSYQANDIESGKEYFKQIYLATDNIISQNMKKELLLAASQMWGMETLNFVEDKTNATLIFSLGNNEKYKEEGFHIYEKSGRIVVEGNTQKALLYGMFELLKDIRMHAVLKNMDKVSVPDKELRMLNHWDNFDGSIERGYSGNSFFFDGEHILINERTRDYARFLASIGINATVINNVNVKAQATEFITEPYLEKLAELQELFNGYGIQLYCSLNYAACMDIGGLDTADPFDENVINWWKERMDLVYRYIPNLGGFLVKADSEGRPGPFTYKRNQAEGANMLAKAIAPHNGTIIWRCFVYNCMQDWRDRKTDRARAAYDYFYDLDGQFLDNVILQIKNGPIDFQVREPFMPLFGKLKHTRHMMEVQIAQEYTGQQIDVCYLMPWFFEILHMHTYCGETADTIGDILSKKSCNQMGCGIAAVTNTGDDSNWTGHDLAGANFYGFGKLAWDSNATPQEIAKEWIMLTFGDKQDVLKAFETILMMSHPAYEKYTAPLGIGFMVTPHYHYGPNIDGYEYARWGTYHRADHFGIGNDRSQEGTGYAMLYHEPLAKQYNDKKKCPDNLLLFFHHVPYFHVLSNGKTVIQHIYDTHFEGVKDVEDMIQLLTSVKDALDETRYKRMQQRFDLQLENAKEWRDQINSYFYRKSAVKDEQGRTIY